MSRSARLFDAEILRSALTRLADTFGVGCLVTDPDGQLLFEYNWSCPCAETPYLSPTSMLAECIAERSFFRIRKQARRPDQAVVISSATGLSNAICRIVVNDSVQAQVIVGLFYLDSSKAGDVKKEEFSFSGQNYRIVWFMRSKAQHFLLRNLFSCSVTWSLLQNSPKKK